MRLATSLVTVLAILGRVIEAGSEARGPEAVYMYEAYRLDVDVSSAEAEANGKTPAEIKANPPWKMARDLDLLDLNEAADWPSGVKDESKYGMNFHAFCKSTNNQAYGRVEGRKRVKDPWNPTLEEVKDISRWPYDPEDGMTLATDQEIADDKKAHPDPRKSKIPGWKKTSFNGFAPAKLFKGLALKDWNKQLETAAKWASEQYEKDPQVGKPHLTKMAEATREAQVARKIDSGDYQSQRVWQMIENWNKLQAKNAFSSKLTKAMIKEKTDTIKSSESTLFAGKKYQNVDPEETAVALQKAFGKAQMQRDYFKNLRAFLSNMAKDFETTRDELAAEAKTKNMVNVQETILRIDNSHQGVMGQLKKLNSAMATQLGKEDGTRLGCGYPDQPPAETKRSSERWLRAKRRAALQQRREQWV